MNNNNIYSPYNNNSNKKKCSCEDKYGPKPFTPNKTNKDIKKPN